MTFVTTFEIELDAENETVAERQFHYLYEALVDEDYVNAFKGTKPVPGVVNVTDG